MTAIDSRGVAPSRWRNRRDKLLWGVRAVGLAASATGAFRVAWLLLRSPRHSRIRLRSGPVLEFDYPSQFPGVLVMFGDLIDPEYQFLRAVAGREWVIVDVGAAIGQFALFAATLPDAVVHAFEPSSANVTTLRSNIFRNGAQSRVTLHRMALSDHDGAACFETEASAWMSHLADRPRSRGEWVPVRTLGRAMAELGISRISVLKINVAGSEPDVLEGAMRVFEEQRVDIMIMLLGVPSLPYYARISMLGYRFFFYDPGRNSLHEVDPFHRASILGRRPWPARHVIALSRTVMSEVEAKVDVEPIKPGKFWRSIGQR